MADASDSKSDVGNNVWVQVPPPAPKNPEAFASGFFIVGGWGVGTVFGQACSFV